MSQPQFVTVTDRDGARGTIDTTQPPPGGDARARVQLESGGQALVPTDLLVVQDDGHYYLPVSLRELARDDSGGSAAQEALVVPVIEETLEVQKRRAETGRVRITKAVREHQEVIDEPLLQDEVSVERVAVGRVVEAAPPIRHEGATVIIPVLEEVLVVEKRLMLKEELRITKRQVEAHEPQEVTLRREEATVERLPAQE